jgi:hypothetical protein
LTRRVLPVRGFRLLARSNNGLVGAPPAPPLFDSMLRAFFSRSPTAASSPLRRAMPARVTATRPPQEAVPRDWPSRLGDWLGASGWRVAGADVPTRFGHPAQGAAVAAARLDFADALWDVRTVAAGTALDRIAVARSLHELWHLRGEVFSHVARLHDQSEAERRVAVLDLHFAGRERRSRRFRADARTASP